MGGVDVRVDLPKLESTDYIPKSSVIFQVKAENFGVSKIPGEMAPKGIIRDSIQELGKKKGAYIIACTRETLSDSSLKNRKKAMLECLTKHGLNKTIEYDFYDNRKIADWVEQHPAVLFWLRSTLNKPIVGWQPYAPWAYKENDIEAEYLLDDKVKVYVPNNDEGLAITNAIEQIRSELRKNVSIRIVGLSGVGKTRLVQALFDKRIGKDSLNSENVIYTDLADDPTPQPSSMTEALIATGSDCVLIVDNCGSDTHTRLTEIVKKPNSYIRLITIEYDIRDDLPEDTLCYRLEGSSESVIKQLLRLKYPNLSDSDIDKITEFSDGNARLAFALASSSETKGELAQLKDEDLFRRMFQQKYVENDGLLRTAEVASLLYSFDFKDITNTSELALLAKLADLSIPEFSRNVFELKKRGLVQERGQWRAVLPHGISNRLALRAVMV